ncbi:hypothetical protein [Bowmanella yangjiangensis]|uniref:Uncharacterized protein n=1 Tax=Bowmanella yangjiangensis TaxID=2811230 RepID=A0ABS3CTK4_9ALTE|nr:hypothetical protein [Bowmanella yangjiangensis]MBN7819761.1 hypothetical protein [Bowmanella yangjiangensis]
MQKLTTPLLLLLCLPGCGASLPQTEAPAHSQLAQIPEPSQQQVDIQVAGRTSRLMAMDVAFVGKQIPYTYSAGKIANSPGYNWWVSKHFAIQSDLPEAKVRLYLELLELSYPQYVELFGAEPPNIERQRIAVVYGSSRERVREAMLDDGFGRGVHATAGGETMYYNRAGYSFPSHRQQHQRYIVIHETMHAFHMALSGHSNWAPNWITEGLADAIASHVYDPKRRELTVMVFDRAPMNYLQLGLEQYYAGGMPSIEQINDDPALKRGLNFFIIHFLLSDPLRAQYFALFRDRLIAVNPHSDATLPTANRLLKESFPDWPALEAGFARFVRELTPSFYIAYGPWEQDGSSYFIRSGEAEQLPRLDIRLPSGASSQQLMDFPAPQPSPLIQLTSASPHQASGLLIDFVPEQLQRGQVGLALGLQVASHNQAFRQQYQGDADNKLDSYLSLQLVDGRYLKIQGHNLLADYTAFALTPAVFSAVQASNQLGISLTTEPDHLQVVLRSQTQVQRLSYPLNPALYQQLSQGDISLLAKDVSHKLTPYLNDGRSTASYQAQNLSNPWQFAQMQNLRRAFVSCQNLKALVTDCQPRLESMLRQLPDPDSHQALATQLDALQAQLLASKDNNLIADLGGIQASIAYHQGQPFLRVVNPSAYPVTLNAEIAWQGQSQQPALTQTLKQSLPTGVHNLSLNNPADARQLSAGVKLQWQNLTNTLTINAPAQPFDGVYLSAQKQQSHQQLHIRAQLSGPYSGQSQGKLIYEVFPSQAVDQSRIEQPISFAPYEQLETSYSFTLSPEYQGEVQVQVVAEVEVDGEALQLKQHLQSK